MATVLPLLDAAPRDASTLRACYDTWSARIGERGHASDATRKQYRYAVQYMRHVPPRPSAADVEVLLERMAVEPLSPTGRTLSAGSINSVLHAWSAVASYAGRLAGDEWIAKQLSCVPDRKVLPKLKPIPPSDVLVRVLPACRNLAERAFVLLASARAGRVGEVRGLLPSDVELPDRLTFLRTRDCAWRKNGGGVVVDLRADPDLRDALAWTVEHHADLVREAGARGGPKISKATACRVFPWSRGVVEELGARLRDALGADVDRYLPRGHLWHAFRRAGAQAVHDAGGDTADVQRLLGDKKGAVAAGYYRSNAQPAPLPRAPSTPDVKPRQRRLPGTDARAVPPVPATGAGRVLEGDRTVEHVRTVGRPGGRHAWERVPTVGAVAAGKASPERLAVSPDVLSVWEAMDREDVPEDVPAFDVFDLDAEPPANVPVSGDVLRDVGGKVGVRRG